MQAYGNYEALTSGGLDLTELFDDADDRVPHRIASDQTEQFYENDSHLVPHVKSDHSLDLDVGTKLEEVSIHTTPSLYSLISVHDDIDNIRGIKKGVSCYHCIYSYVYIFSCAHVEYA